jgi:hypothetical protein
VRSALVLLAVAAIVGVILGVAAGGTTPVAAGPVASGKYYVVGQPVNGQREYLYAIALKTLGNGNRYREIVELNRGRRQPDGGALTDSMEIRPGWVLVLPADASGPSVMTGTPPLPPLPAASAPPTTGAPSAGKAAVSHRTSNDAGLLRVGAFVVAILLLGLALRIMRGGARGRASAGAAGAAQAQPPAPARTRPRPIVQPEQQPEQQPEEHGERQSEEVERIDRTVRSDGAIPPQRDPRPEPSPIATDVTEPLGVAEPLATPRPEAEPPAAPLSERPPIPDDKHPPYLCEELDTDEDRVTVRLVGVAAGRGAPAYAWLADGEEPPPATVPLVLGRKGRWRLHVDLARTPDVVTIVGEDGDCRRQAAAFARQLRASGLGVAVVNDALGEETVPGTWALDRFPSLPAAGDPRPEPHVVLCAGLPDPATARHLVTATEGRAVPVLIGAVPSGRWSIQLAAAAD